MTIVDLIEKKKHKQRLTKEEIAFFIQGYVRDQIPDYQISALLMAIWFNGMDKQETTDLTQVMVASGDMVDLSSIAGIKVDKHSTGGVADTTTLIVAPLVAACGGKVAKMSGRGLGHTGGTLDKLESIPGVAVDIGMDRFKAIVQECGLAVIGQTANLVPADKKLYALRDVTGTIDNTALIASSIMSKKLASGSDAIVLDVKTGNGAFMQDVQSAKELARAMVDIGNLSGKNTVALVTDMNQPLGMAIGNGLEVQEAIEILSGKGSGDLLTVATALAEKMLLVSGVCADNDAAKQAIRQALATGKALEQLARMISAQGGNPEVVHNTGLLPQAKKQLPLRAETAGYITAMHTAEMGMCAMLLGAGRSKKTDNIDPAVGIWLHKRIGDEVKKGELLATFYVNEGKNWEAARDRFLKAVVLGPEKPAKPPLIYGVVE